MRKKMVVGNWKMNFSQAEAVSHAQALKTSLANIDRVDIGICPTYLCLPKVNEVLKGSLILLGAQDCFWVEKGAFTGQISAQMLAGAGVKTCLVGHSETRGRFGKLEVHTDSVGLFAETNFTCNLKVKALLFESLSPILCVGESLEERELGLTDQTIAVQLKEGLQGIDPAEFRDGIIAYEPVWAIGTGKVCETGEASRVCGVIRAILQDVFDDETAESVRILYGGSVKSSNANELFHAPDIDGGLVGGASLVADEFQRIVLSAI